MRRHETGPAGVADHGQARPPGQLPGVQDVGGVVDVLGLFHPDHAYPAQDGIEDVLGTGEDVGVGELFRGVPVRPCRPEEDNGFVPGETPGGTEEFPEMAEIVFHVYHDAPGVGVRSQIVDHVSEIDVDRRAQGGEHAETDMGADAPVEEDLSEGVALGDKGDLSRLRGAGEAGGAEAGVGADDAEAVGAEDPQGVLLLDPEYLLLQAPALLSGFPEPGGDDDHAVHIGPAACLDDLRDRRGGRGHDSQIDVFRDGADMGVAGLPVDTGMAGIDGVDLPFPAGPEVVQDLSARGVRLVTGSDQGDDRGVEHALQVVHNPILVEYSSHTPGRGIIQDRGGQPESLSDEEIIEKAESTAVFARVAPEQKLRLVEALQARKHFYTPMCP